MDDVKVELTDDAAITVEEECGDSTAAPVPESEAVEDDDVLPTAPSTDQLDEKTSPVVVDFTADDEEAASWENDAPVVESVETDDDKGETKGDGTPAATDEEEVSFDCELCKGTFKGQNEEAHEKTAKHQKMLTRLKKYGTTEVTAEMHTIHCHICGTISNSQNQLQIHKKGNKHRTRCQNLGIDPELTEVPANVPAKQAGGQPALSLTCNVCKVVASSIHQLNQHLAGKKHKEKMRLRNGGQDTMQKQPPGKKLETEFDAFQRAWNDKEKSWTHSTDGAAPGLALQSGPTNQQKAAQDGRPGNKRGPTTNIAAEAPAAKRQAPGTAGAEALGGVEMFHCMTCDIFLNSQFQMNEHMNGKVHAEKVKNPSKKVSAGSPQDAAAGGDTGDTTAKPAKKQTQPLLCKECKLTLNSQQQYDQHINSKKHQMQVDRLAQRRLQRQRNPGYFGYSSPNFAPHMLNPGGGRGRGGMGRGNMRGGYMARGNMGGSYMARGNMARGNMARGNIARGNMARGSMARGSMARGNMARGGMARGGMGGGIMERGNMTRGLLPTRPRPPRGMGMGDQAYSMPMRPRGAPGFPRSSGLLDAVQLQGRPAPMKPHSPLMGGNPSGRFQASRTYQPDQPQEFNEPTFEPQDTYEDVHDSAAYGNADVYSNADDTGYHNVEDDYHGDGYHDGEGYSEPTDHGAYDSSSHGEMYDTGGQFALGASEEKFEEGYEYEDFPAQSRPSGIERYGERRSDLRRTEHDMAWEPFY
ncbi:uncharacterized protein LOC135388157 isoform X2 [Ornithodoros turicata]|uniref:uncharacterized protein LOC135388157 isoform X2 n=1 Tax=Ornithodoros turicata TaxID=34597 RepID=UPI003139F2E8